MINRRWSTSKAFTLIEILIVVVILGILAAIVIPQFTKASEDAQVGNVETQLQTVRSQIELYRVKNNGNYPPSITAGTDFSDIIGADYLKAAPINPRTQTSTIAVSNRAAAISATVVPGDTGWIWDDSTGSGGRTLYCNGFNEDFRVTGAANFGMPWNQ